MLATSDLIRKLKRDLTQLQRVPEARRVDELADVREEICRPMLNDQLVGRPLDGAADGHLVRR